MEKSTLRRNARELRKRSTDAEKYLWYYLRANRMGYKFKRQVPIDKYIVDFVCYKRSLIIELDGGQHLLNQDYDNLRTTVLRKYGFEVLRFWNHDVLQDISSVLEVISRALSCDVGQIPD